MILHLSVLSIPAAAVGVGLQADGGASWYPHVAGHGWQYGGHRGAIWR